MVKGSKRGPCSSRSIYRKQGFAHEHTTGGECYSQGQPANPVTPHTAHPPDRYIRAIRNIELSPALVPYTARVPKPAIPESGLIFVVAGGGAGNGGGGNGGETMAGALALKEEAEIAVAVLMALGVSCVCVQGVVGG